MPQLDCNQIVKAKVSNGSRENVDTGVRTCDDSALSISRLGCYKIQNCKWTSQEVKVLEAVTELKLSIIIVVDFYLIKELKPKMLVCQQSWYLINAHDSVLFMIISCIPNFVGVCNFLVITLMQHKNVVLPLLFLCRLLAELWNTISARLFSVHSPDQFFQPRIFPTSHLLQENQNPVLYNLGPLQISRKDSSGRQPCTNAFDTLTNWPWNSVPESRVSSEASLALEHNQAFVSQYVSERVQFSERLMKSGS